MQDYRNEIKDFFAVDKQLAAELEYDMKKYEEQLAREKESDQEQVSTAQAEVGGAINCTCAVSSAKVGVWLTLRLCMCVDLVTALVTAWLCNVLIPLPICWQKLWFQSHLMCLEPLQTTHVRQRSSKQLM